MEQKSIKYTIYCHTHTESGRHYIGLTKKTMLFRWNQHLQNAKKKRGKGCAHFWAAIRKYGKDAFKHEVLEVCYSLEEANEAEKKWISHFDTRNPEKGFNLALGGSHTPHPVNKNYTKLPGFKEAASARSKKIWEDPKKRANILSATQKAIQKPEIRKKISKGVKDLWEDEKYRSSQLEVLKEALSDPKVRKKLSDNWNDPAFREKCGSGPALANQRRASKTHCVNGHERVPENLDAARECKICNYARKHQKRTHCPKGHEYSKDNFKLSSNNRRVCLICLEESKKIKPCSKCGGPKDMKIGNRFRCRPCTNSRISFWRQLQA